MSFFDVVPDPPHILLGFLFGGVGPVSRKKVVARKHSGPRAALRFDRLIREKLEGPPLVVSGDSGDSFRSLGRFGRGSFTGRLGRLGRCTPWLFAKVVPLKVQKVRTKVLEGLDLITEQFTI